MVSRVITHTHTVPSKKADVIYSQSISSRTSVFLPLNQSCRRPSGTASKTKCPRPHTRPNHFRSVRDTLGQVQIKPQKTTRPARRGPLPFARICKIGNKCNLILPVNYLCFQALQYLVILIFMPIFSISVDLNLHVFPFMSLIDEVLFV